jgi:hypothetical protein
MKMVLVEKTDKIVLDTGALFCLVKELKEYVVSLPNDDVHAFEKMKLKMKISVLNEILNRGTDFPFVELEYVQRMVRHASLRKNTIEFLKQEEELCVCGHSFDSHSTSDGGQSEGCDYCNCKEFEARDSDGV